MPSSLLLIGGTIQQQDSIAIERRTTQVAAALRCPVCQGLSIQDSPAPLAIEMRNVVRDQIAAGKSNDEVKAYFVQKYGEWVLLEPAPHGFNLAIYVLPVLLLVGGAVFVWRLSRKWARGRRVVPVPEEPL